MFDNSDFLEIIILAAIAIIIGYRLFNTLGERTGFEKTPEPDPQFIDQEEATPPQKEEPRENKEPVLRGPLQEALQNIVRIDPTFSLSSFLDGATAAFEMIIKAYASGDRETLRSLLNDEVFADFEAAIHKREKKHSTLSTIIVKINPLEVEDILLHGSVAEITVKYVSEQTNILYDQAHVVLEGSPNQIEEVTDVWTFQRNLRASDPNWTLVATGA